MSGEEWFLWKKEKWDAVRKRKNTGDRSRGLGMGLAMRIGLEGNGELRELSLVTQSRAV